MSSCERVKIVCIDKREREMEWSKIKGILSEVKTRKLGQRNGVKCLF
jgi:hypothetical protein